MDFNDTPEEAKFRKEAYEWLKANAEEKNGPKDSWRACLLYTSPSPRDRG